MRVDDDDFIAPYKSRQVTVKSSYIDDNLLEMVKMNHLLVALLKMALLKKFFQVSRGGGLARSKCGCRPAWETASFLFG
jgi:hypothetical protein